MMSPLIESILKHAECQPQKAALISTTGEEISYGVLKDKIIGASAFLLSLGIRKGDRIILSAQKEVEFIYLYLGAHLSGIVNVVVDAKNHESHLDYIIETVTPVVAFGFNTAKCKSVSFKDIDLSYFSSYDPVDVAADELADIMFTSGTTGKPKGVRLSHYNIYSSAKNINEFIKNENNGVELLGLPICHSFGLGRLRCNMLLGSTVVLCNGFANLKTVFQTIATYKITGFAMVPAIWAYIQKFSGKRIGMFASQIKYIEIGSAAMPVEQKKVLLECFPETRICMHYGLTEASRAVFAEFHDIVDDLSAVGVPVSDKVEIRLLGDNGWIEVTGEEGEVCVRGNMVISSYYNESDNENAFLDGYFRTGDWGYFDDRNRLHLVARRKELINVGGKKVSPIEIEEAVESLGISEAMCVAIPDPDGVLGEVPKVLIVKGTATDISLDDVKDALRHKLEAYKMPRCFEFVDAIPKTASGKKQRTLSDLI